MWSGGPVRGAIFQDVEIDGRDAQLGTVTVAQHQRYCRVSNLLERFSLGEPGIERNQHRPGPGHRPHGPHSGEVVRSP